MPKTFSNINQNQCKYRKDYHYDSVNIFIYDGDTIKTDQSDGFYMISQEIDNTIFRNLVQQNQ